MTFFEDLGAENVSGVAYKNNSIKKEIVGILSISSNTTISELSKQLKLSVPKVTNLINELIEEGLVKDFGKSTTLSGRKPNVYGLVPTSGFFIGVDVKHNHVNIGLIDLNKQIVAISENLPYKLDNNRESLEELCSIIKSFIKKTSVPREKILALGLNLTGRINYKTGYSYSFFHFSEKPLSKYLEDTLHIKTFIENDSRAMAYGEFMAGVVKNEKNVLFLNLDYGIGMGTVINGQIYYGKSGFAGEFGHLPLFDNEVICQCGKKGCLETEASGRALTQLFAQKIKNGYTSSLTNYMQPDQIKLKNIIEAVNNDDVLAIDLIAEIGEKIGRGIALLINLYNPELIVLGGPLSQTNDYILLPIKSAINKYSLNLVNTDTQIKLSVLQEKAGVIGACLLVRDRLLDIKYA
ncbi:ROK family protein [Sphingobacterium alkalisoli]|uniref:ROK family protein n=1 Tax=Sphingobacterium alkalisoli TaxID=1874115 RepID=A0A4U0H5E2_9SPHI|nr:ROK family transcriptional regulator [Sphingobacterium alkalisoli]TJY66945.1 ROK family protein [Sphingobacterium alkalisoli]GGH13230.1 transcriptional regulator [Sphingobacterium alkalisoli]